MMFFLMLFCVVCTTLHTPSASETLKFVSHFSQNAEMEWSPLVQGKEDTHRSLVRIGESVASVVDKTFLSIGIDSREVRWKFRGLNFTSPKLQNIASALAPCKMRLGGTSADFLTFDPEVKDEHIPYPVDEVWENRYEKKPPHNFLMSGDLWSSLTNFTQNVGWDVMFDFNLFRWRVDGNWDPSNARALLDFSTKRQIPLPAFQLGNEPNSFHHNFDFVILGDQLSKDFSVLKDLLAAYPLYRDSHIVGPDVTSLGRHPSARSYLSTFLCSGSYKSVSTIGLHQYYLNGRTANVADFLNHTILDFMKRELNYARAINQQCPPIMDVMMTETSSCFGGGAPGLSDRFVAGFLWLDKLGVSAMFGVKSVFRQSFFGGSYSLLSDTADPRPDYFLSVLFKRLVEGPVLNVSLTLNNVHFRLYANCARRDWYQFPRGSVVLYYLNLSPSPVELAHLGNTEVFLLTPGDAAGLTSKFVSLNGHRLEMSGPDLPALPPEPRQGNVFAPAHSFGFVVITGLRHSVCLD